MKALLVILSMMLCFQAFAEEKQMYRWRDANNELHVSQIPPTNLPFETITVSSSRKPQKEPAVSNELKVANDEVMSRSRKATQLYASPSEFADPWPRQTCVYADRKWRFRTFR
ncbi:MAG: DUF4124 domain-containing protein [Rheinheimera sp.]|nr:DUF4124 domain-containing protein [Rheinheimera sp.]